MFQTFTTHANPQASKERVHRLRNELSAKGLAAVLVPRGDEHQGEYVAPSSDRLCWLTGFSGSAGTAVVGRRIAAVFVDGRYTVQARQECDGNIFQLPGIARTELVPWLKANLKSGDVIGFDPWLHTVGEIRRLKASLDESGIQLKPTTRNLVDRVWGKDRPAPPMGLVRPHPPKFAGRPPPAKLEEVQKLLKEARQDAVILTSPDSICWLLNIRGADVAHNPVALCFAIVPQRGKVDLFIAKEKVSREVRAHLEGVARVVPAAALKERTSQLRTAGKRVRIDEERAAWWFARALGKSAVAGSDPIVPLKAIKNTTEIRGARKAHARDGAAMVEFLAWLDRSAPTGSVDEISAVRELEAARARTGALQEISFDTISGSGPNGAIVHYRVTETSNRTLHSGELFLIDSGAQYRDGTTDITRTVAIGTPTDEMRRNFTLVLKGHIAIATARFPAGTRGVDLDPFARRALWDHGLDYDHGTGHGVGSYLSVHEGPQSISRAGGATLQPGMIISNEPGYYCEGHYGIRLENLVLVRDAEKVDGGDRKMMSFETLTLAPFDQRLVMPNLLTGAELSWLNSYHARVLSELEQLITDPDTLSWLKVATAPASNNTTQ